ncbi:MAG: transcription antitermination factor NusB [Candidatus Omnitrophica bacterium]|nr:transcription antitermination factor NusB [Candidatus Omnitrophota bacterium]MBU2250746.1 transcription antitermination factor NusB [Candidatus Omnitrophota bacterium]MBU2265932.1 transcription antitermination factor NusB [Candidatus Omnitrophota bacterium]MBU2473483.1 transcription antitermination factor NusB [Candidatus Omnitrophota bacterium]
MRLRTKSREIALCLLYQIELSKADPAQARDGYLQQYPQKQEVIDFSWILLDGVLKNSVQIDSLIKKYVKNWGIDRMAVIDRNILRIACFELTFLDDIPPKVSINEAIELAKRFGDMDSPRFVNGVLDKIYKAEDKLKNE